MKNVKNVSIEAPVVLNEESLVTIPLNEVSCIYNIYNNYRNNLDNYKKDKCDKYEKKLRADFESNFIGSPKELRVAEEALETKIKSFKSKVESEYYPEAEDAMMEFIRTFTCKKYKESGFNEKVFGILYAKAYEDGHAYGISEIINYLDDFINLFLEVEKAKTATTKE